MATKGYILIETAVGRSRRVVEALAALPGLETVDVVMGPYDIIAVAHVDDLNAIGDLITTKIHTVEGIVRTVTCLSMTSK